MDDATRADMQAYTGCIAGALTRDEFTDALQAAGLTDITITETHRVHAARRLRDRPRHQARRRRPDEPQPARHGRRGRLVLLDHRPEHAAASRRPRANAATPTSTPPEPAAAKRPRSRLNLR